MSRKYYMTFTSLRCFSTKPKIILNDAISTSFSNDEVKYRKHPGIINPKTPTFPNWAPKEINNILKEKQIVLKEIKESSKKLVLHLKGRHPPIEENELKTVFQKVEDRLNANREKKISIQDVNFQKNAKARNILNQNIYNWQPIKFDKLTCLTYLVGRSVQNYAVSYKILNEIKARDNNFRPKTLFDFGSGIGTVMWAASEIWRNSLKEYCCIEVSESMIELSEKLAKAAKPKIEEIFFRQYFPASSNPTYDIVVSAYSLFELPNMETRIETILKLWKKTEHYLVIVEQGTSEGFKLVNEARDFILKYVNSKYRCDSQYAYVFSPCPHDLMCPKFAMDKSCSFSVLYHPLQLLDGREHIPEFYSYIVLKKAKRPEDDEQWPRIVENVLIRSKHTICRMCLSSGELKEEIVTKFKHGKHMYHCAKRSKLGDRLPVLYETQQESMEENDEAITDEITSVK